MLPASKGFVLGLLLCVWITLCTGDPESSWLVTCKQSQGTAANLTSVTCTYSGNAINVTSYDVITAPTKTSSDTEYKRLLSCAVKPESDPNCKAYDCESYEPTARCSVIAVVSSSEPGILGCYYTLTAGTKVAEFCTPEKSTTAEPITIATTPAEQPLEQDKIPNDTHIESCQSKWNSTTTIVLIVSTIVSLSLGALVGYVFAKTKFKKIVISVLAGNNPVKPTVDSGSGSSEPLRPKTESA